MTKIAGSLDLILSTVDVPLDWATIIEALSPKGRPVLLGAVSEPIPVAVVPLLVHQRTVASSPVGSPGTLATMLDFYAARHSIAPITEGERRAGPCTLR